MTDVGDIGMVLPSLGGKRITLAAGGSADVGDKVAILNSGGRRICYPITSPSVGDVVAVAPALGGKTMTIKGGLGTSGVWTLMQALPPDANCSNVVGITGAIVLAITYTSGTIWRSENYGLTWDTVASYGTTIMDFCHVGSGIVLAVYGAGILRSTDYGASFTHVKTLPGGGVQNHIEYLGSGIVLASHGKTVYRSADSGLTWTGVKTMGWFINSLHYCANGRTLVEDSGRVWYSTDTGLNWTAGQQLPYWIQTFMHDGVDGMICFAGIGNNSANTGQVWKSTDGGVTWSLNKIFGASSWYVNGLWNDGGVYYAGSYPDSTVYRSTDGAVTWVVDQVFGWVSKFTKSKQMLAAVSNSGAQIWRRRL